MKALRQRHGAHSSTRAGQGQAFRGLHVGYWQAGVDWNAWGSLTENHQNKDSLTQMWKELTGEILLFSSRLIGPF